MPQVPVQTTPTQQLSSGSMPGFQAPEVKPVQNAAPEQAVKMGEALQGAAKVALDIQDKVDDAATKDADLQISQYMSDRMYNPENGLLNLQGKNALDAAPSTLEDIRQSVQNLEAGLANDTQRAMFRKVAGQRLMNVESQIGQHVFREALNYNNTASAARIELLAGDAVRNSNNPEQLRKFIGAAMVEIQELGNSNGWGEAKVQQEQLNFSSTVTAGVVNELVNDGDYVGAEQHLNDAWKAGTVSQKVYMSLSDSITEGASRQRAVTAGNATYESSGANPTTFDGVMDQTYIHEGADAVTDSNGYVVKFGINQEWHKGVDVRNLTWQQAKEIYRKEYWEGFDIQSLPENMRAIAFDTAILVGKARYKALLRESNGDPAKLLDKLEQFEAELIAKNPGRYGQYRESWANRAARLRTGLDDDAPKDSMESMVARINNNSNLSASEKSMAIAQLKGRATEDEQVKTFDYNNLLNKAMDIAYSQPEGWRLIPDTMWAKLKKHDPAILSKLMHRPPTDDADTIVYLNEHPELWTKEKLAPYRMLLTDDTWVQYISNGANGDKVLSVTYDRDMFKDRLYMIGLGDLVDDKDRREEYVHLVRQFEKAIDAEQRARKKTLTDPEKEAILLRLTTAVKVNMSQDSWFGKLHSVENRYFYDVKDPRSIVISDDIKKFLIDRMLKAGIKRESITQSRLINAYMNWRVTNR